MAGADVCGVSSSDSDARSSRRGSCSLSLPALASAAAAPPGGPGTSSECRRLRSASLAWPRRRSRPGMIGISSWGVVGAREAKGDYRIMAGQVVCLFLPFSGRIDGALVGIWRIRGRGCGEGLRVKRSLPVVCGSRGWVQRVEFSWCTGSSSHRRQGSFRESYLASF